SYPANDPGSFLSHALSLRIEVRQIKITGSILKFHRSGENSMLRKIAFLLLFLLLATGIRAADSVFPYKYSETTLDNGLKIITIPMKNPGLVSYFTVVRAGSRDEIEPGKSGFAHFFEHMMFRGTEKYPPDKYNTIVTSMGADVNANTTD